LKIRILKTDGSVIQEVEAPGQLCQVTAHKKELPPEPYMGNGWPGCPEVIDIHMGE
jgi:hypothetical protein